MTASSALDTVGMGVVVVGMGLAILAWAPFFLVGGAIVLVAQIIE